jgi:tetratricopeptide (TPR) repeat protein
LNLLPGGMTTRPQIDERRRTNRALPHSALGETKPKAAIPIAAQIKQMTHIQILALLLLPVSIALLAFYLVERFWPNAPEWLVKIGLFLLIPLPFLIAAAYFQVQFWPHTPRWVTNGILILIFVAEWTILALWERLLANVRSSRRKKPLFPWRDLGWLLVFFTVWTALEWLKPATKNLGIVALAITVLVLLIAIIAVAVTWITRTWAALAGLWVNVASRQANYVKALQRVQSLRRRQSFNVSLLPLHSMVLLWAGHHQEAEQLWNPARFNHPFIQIMLENVGRALTEQNRYEEAIGNLEKAISLYPKASGAYNYLAEVYLRQGIQPERALELTEQALQRKRESWQERWTNRYRLSEMWANHAWAQALLGRQAEATESLARAFREADRGFKPAMAGLHYRAGQVMILQGNHMTAVEHLSRARQLDHKGTMVGCPLALSERWD